ncbi:MAG: hypothetical protein JSV22_06620 [Bacteroidales bacterium]|nr:MAG: hypothetical protein JSV22_06620 [Bacteroidales bacterium]
MKCGREPGGIHVGELGSCPVPTLDYCHGINSGKSAGRICWAITGTLCQEKINGIFAQELKSCMTCKFFEKVQEEEGDKFVLLIPAQV